MTNEKRFFEGLSLGARLLNELRQLTPGYRIRMTFDRLSEIAIPADPLDVHTPEYKARWLYDRMPFPCEFYADPLGRYFEISRPGRRDDDE